jgi:hypothetical protein
MQIPAGETFHEARRGNAVSHAARELSTIAAADAPNSELSGNAKYLVNLYDTA